MKKHKNLIIIIIIVIGLSSGILFGSSLGRSPQDRSESWFSTIRFPSINSTEVFLVIGLNDIQEPKTELESIWQIEKKANSNHVKLTSLYPIIYNSPFQLPHDPIMVSPAAPLEISDIGLVSFEEIDHLIIMDKYAFWTLIQLSDQSVELPIDHNLGAKFNDFPHAWLNPIESLNYQKDILSYLCKHISPFSKAERVDELVKLINNYLFTDLSLEQLLDYWQSIFENEESITCEIK